MAIQGNFTFKGIELEKAYIRVHQVNFRLTDNQNTKLKTPETYNEDGTIKASAVYETVWEKTNSADYTANVYKDKATCSILYK